MSRQYASSQRALGICDVCGFQYRLRKLKELVVRGHNSNLLACPECWNPDQPQNKLGQFIVEDPQAIRDPRPDSNEYAQSRARLQPVTGTLALGSIGTVTISIT